MGPRTVSRTPTACPALLPPPFPPTQVHAAARSGAATPVPPASASAARVGRDQSSTSTVFSLTGLSTNDATMVSIVGSGGGGNTTCSPQRLSLQELVNPSPAPEAVFMTVERGVAARACRPEQAHLLNPQHLSEVGSRVLQLLQARLLAMEGLCVEDGFRAVPRRRSVDNESWSAGGPPPRTGMQSAYLPPFQSSSVNMAIQLK